MKWRKSMESRFEVRIYFNEQRAQVTNRSK